METVIVLLGLLLAPAEPAGYVTRAVDAGVLPVSHSAIGNEDGWTACASSWYGDELAGSPTASGTPFDPDGLTAAHRTLPLGTVIDVRHASGGQVTVEVNDRGPYIDGRCLDLSRGAMETLCACIGQGVVGVEWRVKG